MLPLIIAHRGLPRAAPENTLPSFEAALRHGPDFVELDYQHSADGVPMVFHDDVLERTTDAVARFGKSRLRVGDLTTRELTALDAGSWFAPAFAGARVPTLAEAIDCVCPRARLMIERKSGDATTLVELLRQKKAVDRVIVQAFERPFLAECGRLEPRLKLGALGEGRLTRESACKAKSIGATVVGWNERDLTAANFAAARAAGLEVWSWTVNDAARARQLAGHGLAGLITDHADLAQAWLADAA